MKRYQRLSEEIGAWLNGQILTDALLADYITVLHVEGKSPATISQAVAAAKWLAKNHGIEVVGEITSKTLAGIRREGRENYRGASRRSADKADERLSLENFRSGCGQCRRFAEIDAQDKIFQD